MRCGSAGFAIMPSRSVRQRRARRHFELLFHKGGEEKFDALTANFLWQLPPQQRSTLLLVYGEGFDYEDAARVLDSNAGTIEARLIRASASLADRLGTGSRATNGRKRRHRDALRDEATGRRP